MPNDPLEPKLTTFGFSKIEEEAIEVALSKKNLGLMIIKNYPTSKIQLKA